MNTFTINGAAFNGPALAEVVGPSGELAGDLLAWAEARSHAVLAGELGETDPDWRPKVRTAQGKGPLPYLVLSTIDGSATYDSSLAPASLGELRAVVYATPRAEAVRLSRLVVAAYQDQPARFEGGSAAMMRCINPFEAAVEDPEPWTDGSQVWGVTRRFRVITGGPG